jgi:hypothetical protein
MMQFVVHDVFVSYASKDKAAADTICMELEVRGIRCWIAPRDIGPGVPWAESIIDALEAAKVMVLVFSSAANASVQIHREVERAVHKDVPIVPLRIEDVLPTRTMEYFISTTHWFDAIRPPLEEHMERLVQGVTALLSRRVRSGTPAAGHTSGNDRDSTEREPALAHAPTPAARQSPQPGPSLPTPAPIAATPPASAAAQPTATVQQAPPAASTPGPNAVPSTLGSYDMGAFLGPGRMGSIVHAGTHRFLGYPVAIRIFQPTPRDNREAVRARFLREARALQVPHPNIIHVRDFGEVGDLMYVVTDIFAGCSLGQLIATEGRLPCEKLHAFVKELIDATVAVHRDGGLISGLNPEIIRVVRENETERLAISSAGINSAQDLLSTMNEASLRGQATANELVYVAPELLMGKAADARSDIFTIGVLAYQMATGQLPYKGATFPELLGAMFSTVPTDVALLRPDLGPEVAEIIRHCIKSDPQGRYGTGAEVFAAWTAAAVGPY